MEIIIKKDKMRIEADWHKAFMNIIKDRLISIFCFKSFTIAQ
jgi:hypothetical protein